MIHSQWILMLVVHISYLPSAMKPVWLYLHQGIMMFSLISAKQVYLLFD